MSQLERSYTVSEVNALRRTLTTFHLFGSFNPKDAVSSKEIDGPWIEEQVRTHMLAGHTAADLYASESI